MVAGKLSHYLTVPQDKVARQLDRALSGHVYT